jgi:CRISPR-associated protein Cas1
MSYLYVCEQGARISFEENRFDVRYKGAVLQSIPAEMLEVIEVFGKVQITTQCVTECLKRGINILYYSLYGAYYGRLISTTHVNVGRQADIERNEEFKLNFAKKIINAKIKNQIVILRRYSRDTDVDVYPVVRQMQNMNEKVLNSKGIEQLMGYEGNAARLYFGQLGELINPAFFFTGRTKRPPTDPFNSMISLGYSIVLNELYGKLEGKGLNPYVGIMHKDREKHPTLASDLMEEWRAVLVDSTALSMLNGNELKSKDFYMDLENPGVYLEKEALKKYIEKLEGRFRTENRYLTYVEYSVNFRRAMDLQVNQFVKAIETENVDEYFPIVIR